MNLQQALEFKGYLNKKSTGLMGWQKRWYFILEKSSGNYSLLYQDQEKSPVPKGEIDLNEVISVDKINDKKFTINSPGRTFELEAKTGEDCKQWVIALNLILNKIQKNFESKGMRNTISDPTKVSNHKKVSKEAMKAITTPKLASQKSINFEDQEINEYHENKRLTRTYSIQDNYKGNTASNSLMVSGLEVRNGIDSQEVTPENSPKTKKNQKYSIEIAPESITEKLEKTIDEYKQKVRGLQQKITETEFMYEELKRESENSLNEVKFQLSQKEKLIQQQEKSIKNIKQEREELADQISTQSLKVQQLERENESLRIQMDQLSEKSELKKTFSDINSKLRDLQDSLNEKELIMAQKDRELKEIKTKLEESNKKNIESESHESNTKQLKFLGQKVQVLESQITLKDKLIKQKEQTITELENDLKILNEELKDRKKKQSASNISSSTNLDSSLKLDYLKDQLAEKEQRVQLLEQMLAGLKQDPKSKDNLKSSGSSMTNSIDLTQNSELKIIDQEAKINKLKEQNLQLINKQAEAQKREEEMKQQIMQLEQSKEFLNHDLKYANEEAINAKMKNAQIAWEAEKYKDLLHIANKKIKDLEESLK